nr:Mor transcription activator family protein [Comamonas thiooxydans]
MPHWTYLAKAWPVSEELAAAALCHGVERVEDLTEELVRRYVQRLGGLNVYVRNERERERERERVAQEIRASFDRCNARELACRFGLSVRQVQRLLSSTEVGSKPIAPCSVPPKSRSLT